MRPGMLLLVAAGDLAIWILAGLFATSEFYRRAIVMGGDIVDWHDVLIVQMVTALNWAAFTPLVVFLAQCLPLRPPHRLRNAAIVIALLPPLAVLRAAMGGAVMNLGEGHPISRLFVIRSIEIRTHRYIAILAAIFFVHYLVDAQREAAKRERQRVRAQTLLARTEIEALRARLQPQFALCMLRHIGSVAYALDSSRPPPRRPPPSVPLPHSIGDQDSIKCRLPCWLLACSMLVGCSVEWRRHV